MDNETAFVAGIRDRLCGPSCKPKCVPESRSPEGFHRKTL